MRVALLTTHLNVGGITRYLLTLTKGLIYQGHNVYIISGGGEMAAQFESLGAFVYSLDIKTKSELSPKIYLALKPLKKFIKDHEIQLIHAQTRVTQVMGSLLRKRKSLAYASTCHGYYSPRIFRRLFPCWGNVIAISPAVVDHLQNDFKVPRKNIQLIPNGIDFNDFPEITPNIKQESRQRFGLREEFVIGMVARLSDVKGQDIILNAMPAIISAVGNVKLFFFGEGKLKEYLEKIVNQLKLENHVTFYPVVKHPFEALGVMDVCVIPSRQEGLGLSVMEAQVAGVPVVASHVGGIPSLIRNEETGILVPPTNIDALAKAVIDLLKNPSKREGLVKRARSFALSNYSYETMIHHTINFYQRVIRDNGI